MEASRIPAPPEGSVLGRRAPNRALLARQHLLRRESLPVPAMVDWPAFPSGSIDWIRQGS